MNNYLDIEPYCDKDVQDNLIKLLEYPENIARLSSYLFPKINTILPKFTQFFVKKYFLFKFLKISSVYDFQLFIEPYVARLIKNSTRKFCIEGLEKLDPNKNYLFLSNHRDIATDPLLINYALHKSGFDTMRIAIGDNLLNNYSFGSLMRLNKSFIVKRSLANRKEKFLSIVKLSSYINKSIKNDKVNVWMSHKEGRAKDGIDKTDISILKMLYISQKSELSFSKAITELNIVPVSISYEYDPIDIIKAEELLQVKNTGNYIKHEREDENSIIFGLFGYNGDVSISFSEPIDEALDSPAQLAERLDTTIASNQKLYPTHILAHLIKENKRNTEDYNNFKKKYPKQYAFLNNRISALSKAVYDKIIDIYNNIYLQGIKYKK